MLGRNRVREHSECGLRRAVHPRVPHLVAMGTGPLNLNTAYLHTSPASCGGSYFNSIPATCSGTTLTVKVNLGTLNGTYPNPPPPGNTIVAPLRASDVEVRYMMGRSDGTTFCDYGTNCELVPARPTRLASLSSPHRGTGSSPHPPFTAIHRVNEVAIRIGIRNTTNLTGGNCANFNAGCRWWWLGGNSPVNQNQADTAAEIVASPVQSSFAGSVDRTGPLKWLHLIADTTLPCDSPSLGLGLETEEAASVPAGTNCFYVQMGLQGAVAKDQDEPPIAFNLGSTGSQRAFLDCDPAAGGNLGQRSRTAAHRGISRTRSRTRGRAVPTARPTTIRQLSSARTDLRGTLRTTGRHPSA